MSRLYPHTLARLSYITATFQSSTIEIGGSYKIGPEIRPVIKHDSEFSNFPKQEPTLGDYVNLLKWVSMLEGAAVLRPDLADGVAAYRHFHDGEGKGKMFAYDRYILNDASGKITLRNAVLGAQDAAITLWENNGEPTEFSFTGPAIHCGANNPITPYNSRAFPYPATENWQKTIGAHYIWLSGKVTVAKAAKPEFTMQFTLNAEDQYNFNPGMKDITSGLPDDDNGQFVVVGFAKGFRYNAILRRVLSWKGFDLGVASMGIPIQHRSKSPKTSRY